MLAHEELTSRVIAAAIDVHRHLGPGLLESAYERCLCHELELAKIPFHRQAPLPVIYKGISLDCGYDMDVVVDQKVVLELKAVERLLPVHEAQLLTYLKLGGLPGWTAHQLQCSGPQGRRQTPRTLNQRATGRH
jgi:GxxExxY protein